MWDYPGNAETDGFSNSFIRMEKKFEHLLESALELLSMLSFQEVSEVAHQNYSLVLS